jgi:hypothetical protein
MERLRESLSTILCDVYFDELVLKAGRNGTKIKEDLPGKAIYYRVKEYRESDMSVRYEITDHVIRDDDGPLSQFLLIKYNEGPKMIAVAAMRRQNGKWLYDIY